MRVLPGDDAPLMLARTIRGLEPIAAGEIADAAGVIDFRGHREVFFRPMDAGADLLELKTVDDVFLVVDVLGDVGTTKAELADFGLRLKAKDFSAKVAAAMDKISDYAGRTLPEDFNVSASFLGKRNYSRFDIEDAVGAALTPILKGNYHSRRAGAIPPSDTSTWRVMIRDREAVVALRLAEAPLHRRAYKVASIPGTVHPPVAAAMARLANIHSGHQVLDPCCGAGTIVIEAAISEPGARYKGLDISPESLTAARSNSSGMNNVDFARGDAGHLDIAAASIDRILVNPPWGQQVDAQKTLLAKPSALWVQSRKVLRDNGLLVALSHSPDDGTAMTQAGFRIQSRASISLFGSHPEIIVAKPDEIRERH